MADNTINYNLIRPSADDFYNIQEFNDNMTIIDTELKNLDVGKAPSGHGLGGYPDNHSGVAIKSVMQKGCGFYQVDRVPDTDNPADTGAWLTLLQMARVMRENEETGVQMLFSDLNVNKPQMWFRNMSLGTTSKWVEMLHTGNIGKYADAKFACGTYTGVLSGAGTGGVADPFYRSKTLPLPFKADYVDIICVDDYTWRINIARNVNKAILMWQNFSVNQSTSIKWSGNNVTWGNTIASNETGNLAVMNNAGYTYAWFAYGKGEGV